MTYDRPESMLDAHQRYMVKKIRDWKAVLLACDMGLGKTAACLKAARELLDEFRVYHVLIVGPLRVATDTWPDEIREWSFMRGVSFVVAVGTPGERLAAVNRKAEITIINRENFVWLYKLLGDDWHFDMIVWDESSSLKAWKHTNIAKDAPEGKKKRLTWFGALARVQSKTKYMIELTGTPAPNGVIDLGGQAYILDEGRRLGRSKEDFYRRWFFPDWSGYNYEPRPGAEAEIMAELQDIMVAIKSEDYTDRIIPDVRDVFVTLTPRLLREYHEFERTLVAEEYDVEAVNSGVLTGKLLQFANGAMYKEKELRKRLNLRTGEYDDRWEKDVVPVHTLKLDALESVIEEAGGRPILLAYPFKFDREAILKRFGKRYGVRCIAEEKNGIRDWNAGKVRVALVHPASIGHGTNLQYGGSIACWYGLTWSGELYDQFNMRLPRRGQKDAVTIYRILARGTLDIQQATVLETKGRTQSRITDAVRIRRKDLERELGR